ncbi:T9SS type A sorting domain-containing protein [Rufibacter sediminis]|uniref:T9SS type A sorting domain-containing protein n=1 Tax=Rufibacter sediminis TaxID=2762756 RepID=A0ABR6VY20_9BACT|nr:T9SS type A sorting domain-containing protein [Rufibacter sediminis]MBC3542045.1 T9SS type A sorting domain-containing protein [Rufibacter sediminis]
MNPLKPILLSLLILFSCLVPRSSPAQAASEVKLKVVSIKPSINTGTNYSAWLAEDLDKLVETNWSAINKQYVDVVLKLETRSAISRVSLFDHEGIFRSNPATIYALNGTERIKLGTFNGSRYMEWVDVKSGKPVEADAIIIRKYLNNIPQKVKIYGKPLKATGNGNSAKTPAVISFAALPTKTYGDAAFKLTATSTNTNPNAPITFTSSNTAVATVANTAQGWKVTIKGAGTANIIASQPAFGKYAAAVSVSRALVVSPKSAVITFAALPTKKVGDAPFFLTASSTNTATPITFTSSNTAVATVAKTTSGWKVTLIGAGTTTIKASQAASSTYAAAPSVSRALTVTSPAPVASVITFTSLPEKKFGDAPFLLKATSTNTATPVTFTSSNTGVVSVANTSTGWKATIVGVGIATITAKQAAGNGYAEATSVSRSQVVSAQPAVISFAALPAKKVGDAPFMLQATSTNTATPVTFTSSNPAVATVTKTTEGWKATILKAGTTTIIAAQAAGGNYAAAASVSRSLVVSEVTAVPTVPSVITFAALPAKKEGDVPFALTATSTNTVTPITFTSSNPAVVTVANTSAGWKATVVGAGTASITASQIAGNNYAAAAPVSRTLTVSSDINEVKPPNNGPVVQGEIPYKAYWGYHKDKSNQSIDKLFNGVINETVHMGTSELLPEADIVLNFPDQMEVELQKISFFDGQGSIPAGFEVKFIYVEKGTGREIAGPLYNGSRYNFWIDHAITTPIKVSAVILRKKKGVRLPDEIKFYGKYKPYTPPTFTKPAYPLKRMLGINTYPSDNTSTIPERLVQKINAIAPYHVVRDYVDWGVLETNMEGEYAFQPTMKGNWKMDDIYARHKANGKEVLVCLKNIPGWMLSTYPAAIRDAENAPMPYKSSYTTVTSSGTNYFNEQYTADKQKPASYVKAAKLAFQFAARYGSNTNVNPALVKTKSTVKIGLNLISKMEANNEPDRHWKGRQANQTSDEYAAYLSAFYDGHMGTLGADVGVKQADPNMKVVCAGIASTKTAFYQGIIDWCKKNRGYLPNGKVNLCFDEINYHAYNNNYDGEQYANGSRVGVAPELSLAPLNINNFHQINREFIGDGDMPIIITETGYDWNSTTQGTKVIGSKDKFQVQGDWILRSSLEYAMAGLSGLYFYQLYDDPSGSITNTTQYATSGHVDRETFVRRPAADYMAQVWKHFGDFVPVERLSKDPRIDKYRDDKGQNMYAAWIPDEKDRRSDYTLSLGTDSANVYYTRIGRDSMEVVKVKTVGGKLKVTVSETPIFIVATGQPVITTLNAVNTQAAIAPQLAVETRLNVYPNPFTQNTTLEFVAAESGDAVVDIFDAQGKLIKHLFVGKAESGVTQALQFNGTGLPGGVYIARFTTGKQTVTKKLLLIN